MSVKLIDKDTINLISAGQVLKGYYDIVKELVENSIDAGSSRIFISVSNNFIKIEDSGSGMNKEDLENSVKKNYTSKINNFKDLQDLKTLGFRGEALYFIEQVADLEIITKQKDQIIGLQYKNQTISEIVADNGTTIKVTNVFGKVFGKSEFMPKLQSEVYKIKDLIEAYNLVYNIEFIYKANNDVFFFTNENPIEKALSVDNLNYKEREFEDIKIRFYFSKQVLSKITNFIFVNKRPIKDKNIISFLKKWYYKLTGKEGFNYCLFIELNPIRIDFNIHPSKTEILFNKNTKDIIFFLLSDILEEKDYNYNNIYYNPNEAKEEHFIEHNNKELKNELVEEIKSIDNCLEKKHNHINIEELDLYKETDTIPTVNNCEKSNCKDNNLIGTRVIGQLFKKYILTTDDKNFYIIDQHAADERLIMDRYNKNDFFYKQLIQPILLDKKKFKEENLKEIFEYEDLGENFLIKSVISFAENEDIQDFLNGRLFSLEEYLRSYGCRRALKAGTSLSIHQMELLVENLQNTQNKEICNHGRRTFIKLSENEIDKLFGRKDGFNYNFNEKLIQV